ncbi:TPA: helix-turn-helix domain-containing protein [Enterobacter roggenkampii]|nr:helix-turn-helix domain-containing protein [Enterobacter roggenkampii]
MSGLITAIERSGSAKNLADKIGITKQAISLWHRMGIPATRVLQIFNATGVTPHELRPDLYPNPTDGLPVQNTSSIQKDSD